MCICAYPSYNRTQDASRLGADIQGNNSVPEQHLLDIVYNNLAVMHNVDNLPVTDPKYRSPQWYKDETISHFGQFYDPSSGQISFANSQYIAHDWYHDEFTAGGMILSPPLFSVPDTFLTPFLKTKAYAQFLPNQYNCLYPKMTVPGASGYLHISGEAMSAHHAWIEGALVAAWRSVYHILLREAPAKIPEFVRKWPPPDEIDIKLESRHAALALALEYSPAVKQTQILQAS